MDDDASALDAALARSRVELTEPAGLDDELRLLLEEVRTQAAARRRPVRRWLATGGLVLALVATGSTVTAAATTPTDHSAGSASDPVVTVSVPYPSGEACLFRYGPIATDHLSDEDGATSASYLDPRLRAWLTSTDLLRGADIGGEMEKINSGEVQIFAFTLQDDGTVTDERPARLSGDPEYTMAVYNAIDAEVTAKAAALGISTVSIGAGDPQCGSSAG